MSKSLRALASALLMALGSAGAARGQQLLDWTVRQRVEPEALSRGAEALFWNPAGLGELSPRGEALSVVLQSTRDLGLKAVALAGGMRLRGGTAVAAGYQHFGIDDIQRTDATPPDNGTSDLIGVGEDRLTLAMAQPLGRYAWAGARVEYARSAVAGTADGGFAFGAGALLRLPLALAPEVGVSGLSITGSSRWQAGVAATVPGTRGLLGGVRAGYGISGQSDRSGRPAHRLSLTGDWRGLATVSLAETAEKANGDMSWMPAAMGELRLGRYLLGVVHETLANDFGGATSVHLGVRF